jgi:hypothetical protein
MLFAGIFKKPISVSFEEEGTGRVIATWRIPLDKVPETFQPGLRLKMGGENYVVVAANPPTRALAAERRQLKVLIRIDPKSTS